VWDRFLVKSFPWSEASSSDEKELNSETMQQNGRAEFYWPIQAPSTPFGSNDNQ
jgi:hypothetical protein